MEISQSIFKIDTSSNFQFVDTDFVIDGIAYFPAMVLGVWKIIPAKALLTMTDVWNIIPGKALLTMTDGHYTWPDFGEFDSADSAIAFATLRAD